MFVYCKEKLVSQLQTECKADNVLVVLRTWSKEWEWMFLLRGPQVPLLVCKH